MLPTPPALPGLPVIGNLLAYRKDHVEVFWHAYRSLGSIFTIRLGPQNAVVLIGPEHHRFFFTQVDRLLSMPEIYKFVVPMFGRVLNAEPDVQLRRKQLNLMHSAMQGERMRAQVDVMVHETSAWLDTLGHDGEFELYDAFSKLAMKIAASAFMGREIRERLEEFVPLYEDLARGMDFVLPPNLPLPRFRRRDRARQRLNAMLGTIIAERRAGIRRSDDFLQTIVDGRDAGCGLTADETVVGFALMTVFTGYITTAAQLCWSLVQLLQHPDYLALVQSEQASVFPPGVAVSVEALGRLERLEWALKESQRMHPVMSHYARYNAEDYELSGYRVPKGWLTMVCPAVAHRLPEVFSRPDTYDPERFAPGREEDQKPYSLIGFSEGLYKCPGARFGINEMKCVVSLLLQRYSLRLLEPAPVRDFEMGVIRPKPPCLVRYAARREQRIPITRPSTGVIHMREVVH